MKPFTKIAIFVFVIVSVGHLLRLIRNTEVELGSYSIPMWVSYFGVLAAAILAWGVWKESRR